MMKTASHTQYLLAAYAWLIHSSWMILLTLLTLAPPALAQGAPIPPASEFSDHKPGAVLFYNLYASGGVNTAAENTEITLTNLHPTQGTAARLFFVNGTTGASISTFVSLPGMQTVSLLASDYDPGVRGYVVAVAVDPVTGAPQGFNYLTGSASFKLASGHAGSLSAQAIAALYSGGLATWSAGQNTATLLFDGNAASGASYNRLPRALSLTSAQSPGDGNNTRLVINRVSGALTPQMPAHGLLAGVLYDATENGYGFVHPGPVPQLFQAISNSFPHTGIPLTSILSPGSYGWMKLWPVDEQAVLGAAINFNPNAATNGSAYNYAVNLGALTLVPASSLLIPVSAPGLNGTFSLTTLTGAPNPSISGQSVTLTATVTGSPAGTPAGNVQFYDGAALLGTSARAGGQATLGISSLTIGAHQITAVYTGGGAFPASFSGALIQVVSQSPKTATATTLGTTLNPASEGQPLTLTANVSGEGGPPTVTVQFLDGVTPLGTATLTGGLARLSTSALTAGTHPLSAAYAGSPVHNASVSAALSQVVNPVTSIAAVDTSGPGNQRTGSVLVWNYYSSDAGNPAAGNTLLAINNSGNAATTVQLFFVNGADGASSNQFLNLGPQQTSVLDMSATDPGASGYAIAIAVDPVTGCPVSYNQLSGEANIKTTSGVRATLPAQAFRALYTGGLAGWGPGQTTATLRFDGDPGSGSSYERAPYQVATDMLATPAQGNAVRVILNRFGGDLTTATPSIGTLSGVAYHSQPSGYGFVATAGPQLNRLIDANFPSLAVSLNVFFDTMQLSLTPPSGVAMTGATLQHHPAFPGNNSYSGGSNMRTVSLQPSATLTVPVSSPGNGGALTTTTVDSSNASATTGDNLTFTATVASGAGAPTGNVQFYAGATLLGTGALGAGTAIFSTNALPIGSHIITAVYLGDGTFKPSASNGLPQVVSPAVKFTPAVTLTTDVNPASEKQAITLTATVSGTAGAPTGQVRFSNGVQTLATVPLIDGQARLTISTLVFGTHTLRANYQGDAQYLPVQSPILSQVIRGITSIPPAAASEAGDQRAGSVLLYQLYTSAALNQIAHNTQLSLTNTDETRVALVQVFLVDGASGVADPHVVSLTPGQTSVLNTGALDPGATGFAIAVATDPGTGSPVSFNALVGEANIKTADGLFATLPAQAIAALYTGGLSTWSQGQTAATLVFDGNEASGTSYQRLPHTLAAPLLPARGDGNRSSLVLNRIGGALNTNAPAIGREGGALYDITGGGYGFGFAAATPQLFRQLGQNQFPHLTPGYNTLLSAGSYGWMELASGEDSALTGALLNFNPSAASNGNAHNSAVNLRVVSLRPHTTLTVPVTAPAASNTVTRTVITSSQNPAVAGQLITLTANVTATQSTPTGNVAFYDGAVLLDRVALNAGTATFSTSALTAGAHILAALYEGDGLHQPGASQGLAQTITNPAAVATATALTSTASPASETQAITLTATVNYSGTSMFTGSTGSTGS
ncbi:MAG: Ig-like domain repeat protein, partial [Blastocatellia bacterium]